MLRRGFPSIRSTLSFSSNTPSLGGRLLMQLFVRLSSSSAVSLVTSSCTYMSGSISCNCLHAFTHPMHSPSHSYMACVQMERCASVNW